MKIYDTTSLDGEEWRDIPGYEGLYQVSNMGRVKSLIKKRILLSWLSRGYEQVHLCNKGIRKPYLIHRLVGSGFLSLDLYGFSGMKNSLLVCHKDDNPSNNKLDNLFLGTSQDNINDAYKKGKGNFSKKVLGKKLKQVCHEGNIIGVYKSVTEASKITGYSHGGISVSCREGRSYKGYKWVYI